MLGAYKGLKRLSWKLLIGPIPSLLGAYKGLKLTFGGGLEFLDKVMDLSVDLNEKLKTLNLQFVGSYGIAVMLEKFQDREFLGNEEESAKPYVWFEKWKGKMIVRRGKVK